LELKERTGINGNKLPCVAFQKEIIKGIRHHGHLVIHDFSIGNKKGDILDFESGEWIEVDRFNIDSLPTNGIISKLEKDCKIFVEGLEDKRVKTRVLIVDILGCRSRERKCTLSEITGWYSSNRERILADEIRIYFNFKRKDLPLILS